MNKLLLQSTGVPGVSVLIPATLRHPWIPVVLLQLPLAPQLIPQLLKLFLPQVKPKERMSADPNDFEQKCDPDIWMLMMLCQVV
jgi:hypothetical protein